MVESAETLETCNDKPKETVYFKLSIVWNFILTLDMSRPLVQVLSFYNLGDFMFRCGLLLPDSIIIFRGVAYYVCLMQSIIFLNRQLTKFLGLSCTC
jgi:hypothetical protein